MARKRVAPTELEAMTGCVCASLRRTTRAVTQLYDEALRPHGLRATQLPILVATTRRGRIPLALLAEHLGMDRTTLLRNVRPLARRNLVRVATEEGSRRSELCATEAGRALLARVHPSWKSVQARVLKTLRGVDWSRTLAALTEAAAKPGND
jgi:DNA-binding MarR family transcriptional regulator